MNKRLHLWLRAVPKRSATTSIYKQASSRGAHGLALTSGGVAQKTPQKTERAYKLEQN